MEATQRLRPLTGLAVACLGYLAGVAATELVVFDCLASPRVACLFYAASLPSLLVWPQGLRIWLPVLGVAVGVSSCIITAGLARPRSGRRLRLGISVGALLAAPGMLSFAGAVSAAGAFCHAWQQPLGLGRRAAMGHLTEVRMWHGVMLVVLLACAWLEREAEMR